MGFGSTDFNAGQAIGAVGEAFAWKRSNDALAERVRKEMYVANSLEDVAANKDRMITSWDNIVWEIVKRIKDFDPETRYRILGVCKGQDATPEDTLRALREVQDAWYQKIKATAPEDNSDTNVPSLRKKYENAAI
jgi:hypothetical protein